MVQNLVASERRRARSRRLAGALVIAWSLAAAAAQQEPPDGTPVRRIEVKGLTTISESFIRRSIRTREEQPYSRRQLQDDVRTLLRTRKFLNVFAAAELEENQAVVIFTLQEKPEIVGIEIDGNKRFTDDELFKELTISVHDVIDRYEINRSRENIERKYREKGYYDVQVTVDAAVLQNEGRVVFHVTEGPRVRTRKILFEGVRSFPEPLLRTKVRSKTYFWIFEPGAFDADQAERDAFDLQSYYRGEGYLDARVGYRTDFDTIDRTRLNLVFVVEEGVRYRVQEIVFEGNEALTSDRLHEAVLTAIDDYYRDEKVRADAKRIQDVYGELGYVEVRVDPIYDFLEQPEVVRLRFQIYEGLRSTIGRITIRGNRKTKDEVVRRELRFYPGEDFNMVKAREAEKNLKETTLFKNAKVTPLEDIKGVREALIEVEEADAINFLIGVGVSTDNGVLGSLTIENRNFDLFDWPRTPGEFFRGQSFRGDGQRLKFQAEPGTEVSRFRIDFTEPYLFDKPLRFDASLYLFQRDRGSYTEERLGFIPSLSKRFETGLLAGWALEGALRVEGIDIKDVEALASKQIRDVEGDSTLTSVKATIVRDTTDSRFIPSKGYRFLMGWEQVGALGGDYYFGKPTVSFTWYKTLRTDLFDRKSILAVRADSGWVVNDAPVFERFYAGGFGSLRGFEFRGISPRAGVLKDRVGGDFILLTGAEYSVPIYAENIRGVTFLDMGTVEEDFEIRHWRASVGFGLRIVIDFFGPVPMVFDFGFPIASDDQDDTQVFNFAFGASF